jgi:arylsulfatase A-like enzyme
MTVQNRFRKRIALNAPEFPQSKFTMKAIRRFLLLAALLPLNFVAHAESLASIVTNVLSAAAVPPRTSIIFIECHGLGVGDLSCYGQTNFQTPNLDRLAAGGIRFTDYRAAGAEFSPAQAALMTGKNSAFAPGETTVAQRLQQAGYHTGLIGEWTLGAQPWNQGFDEFAGFLNDAEGKNYYSDFLWRYAPKSIVNETNKTFEDFIGKEMIYPNTGGRQGQYLPDLLITAAANFARVNQPDAFNHFRPFFLLVSLPAPRRATTGADDFPVPTDAPFTGEQWPQAAKKRAALITRLDAGIGRLLEQLQKLGMTNDVAIFFTSAVAPEKFADTNLAKLFRPDGNFSGEKKSGPARLPMIAHWPAKFSAGTVSSLTWSAQDFAPTALEMAFQKPATNYDGNSILPILHGKPGTNTPALPDRLELPSGQ